MGLKWRTFGLVVLGIFISFFNAELLFCQTNVNGIQSGLWTVSNSPYIITDDVIVPKGLTLTVEPGVIINFSGPFRMIVAGSLMADGNPVQPIIFTSKYDPIYGTAELKNGQYNVGYNWYGIDFMDSSDDYLNRFNHCYIRYCQFGIKCHDALPLLTDITFAHVERNKLIVNDTEIPIQPDRSAHYLSGHQRSEVIPVPKPVDEPQQTQQHSQQESAERQKNREDSLRAAHKPRPTEVKCGVIVLQKKELEKMGCTSLSQIVEYIPGVYRTSSYWDNSIITGRSAFNNQFNNNMLILFDEIPLSAPMTNAMNLDQIPLDAVDKIEIYRTPANFFQGKNAFSGIIRIIPTRATDKIKLHTSTAMGSHYMRSLQSYLHQNRNGFSWSVGTNFYDDNGYVKNIRNSLTTTTDLIDFENDNYNFCATVGTNNFKLFSNYYRQYQGLVGFYPLGQYAPDTEIEGFSIGAKYNYDLQPKIRITFVSRYGYAIRQEQANLIFANQNYAFAMSNGYIFESDFDIHFNSRENPALIGFNIERHGIKNLFQPVTKKTNGLLQNWDVLPKSDYPGYQDYSIYAQAGYNFSPFWGMIAGLRYSYVGKGGHHIISPSVSLIYDPLPPLQIELRYGHGHRNPSPFERMISIDGKITSSDFLKPEQIHSLEYSLDYSLFHNFQCSFSAYRKTIYDLIALRQNNTDSYLFQNIADKYNIAGVEGVANYELNSRISIYANASFTTTLKADSRQSVDFKPRFCGNIKLFYKVSSKLSTTAGFRYIGKQNSAINQTTIEPGYLIDLKASYDVLPHITVEAVARNILNQQWTFFDDNFSILPGEYPRTVIMQLNTYF